MSNAPTTCKNCGSTAVEWKLSKAGKWYLADMHNSKIQGAPGSYTSGPHFKSCVAAGPRAEQLRAQADHNAKVQAERDAHQAKMEAFAAAQDWDGLRNYIEGVA
jgi:hypothetical protein